MEGEVTWSVTSQVRRCQRIQPVFPSDWQYASLPLMANFAATKVSVRASGVPEASTLLDHQ